MFKYFVLFLLFTLSCCQDYPQYRPIGSFNVKLPGFLNFGVFNPSQEKANNSSLIITSFSGVPLTKDHIYLINDIGSYYDNIDSIKPETVTNKIIWPNEGLAVNYTYFNQSMISVGDGFIPPYKHTGEISLIQLENNNKITTVTTKKDGWFYHIAQFVDGNGDGLQDILTARANVPTNGDDPSGQLLFLKNPGDNALDGGWEETILIDGPDILIELVNLDGSENPQLIASQFFSEELVIYWTETEWSDPNGIKSRIIDNDLGAPFGTQLFDINNDGKMDLLASNHEHEAMDSAVFGYEIPENWKTDEWKRHVLSNNITTRKRGQNQASPGLALAFHPSRDTYKMKPLIAFGGDGAEESYLITPNSQDPDDWTYTRQVMITTGCTVGQIAIEDINNDGYAEIFIPAYENGVVSAFSFSPPY